MKKTKTKILIIVVLVYAIFGIYAFFSGNHQKEKRVNASKEKYIIIDNYVNLLNYKNDWYSVGSSYSKIADLKYNVYIDNEYLGNYKLKYGTVWNIFDNNDSYIDYDSNLFAYSDNFDLDKEDTNIRHITSKEKEEISNEFGYNNYNYLLTNDVIDIDIDNNGVEDKIVAISSNGEDIKHKDNYFNLVYINLNGNLLKIINENSDNCDILKADVYNLSELFNIEKHKYLVIKKTTGIISDSPKENALLYDYTKIKKIKKIKITNK